MNGPFWKPVSADEVTREYADPVYRQLKRIFGPRADVDDLFQNVFIEVLRSLPTWSGRARLGAWVRRVTTNVAYQEMRLSYRRPTEVAYDEQLDRAPDDPERALRSHELYRALFELEPKLRIVVVLYDIEGLTMKEIGQQLGRPLPTIQSQLQTARSRLAEALTDQGTASGGRGKARDEDSESGR